MPDTMDPGWGRDEFGAQPYGQFLETLLAIEEGIKDGIRAAMPYLKKVETYAGQLEGEIEELTILFPAVFVSYGGSDFEWIDGQSFQNDPVFKVIVVAKDLRGQTGMRGGEYGCYRMIIDTLNAIANCTFGKEIQPLKPVKVTPLFISKAFAAYGIDFQTQFDTAYPQ